MAGDFKDPVYNLVKMKVNQNFTIKAWKVISEHGNVDYIGMQWRFMRESGMKKLIIHMDRYIDDLATIPLSRTDDIERDLTKDELTQFKSLLAKARWPISR
eukprot:11138672-Karenia_brevis.AAC.1